MNPVVTPHSPMQRLAAWLGLWAMLVPLLTTLVHHPLPERGAIAAHAPMMSMAMQGCPGMGGGMGGMAMQAAPPAAPHTTPQPIAPKKTACPICQFLHLLAGGFVPPDLTVLAVPFVAAFTVALQGPARQFASFNRFPQARPRAPPVLFSL